MTRDLTGLFSPNSIAVIGASAHPEKVGAIALKNIIVSGFRGRIYPVNPNVSAVGKMKFYPDVTSLPEVPDLAVVAVPAEKVLEVITDVGEKGIKNAVIFSAGFKEAGAGGEKLEGQLIEIADKYQINILGPNCLGFANNGKSLNITFGQVFMEAGNLRIASQSGALAASMFDWCQTTNLGFDQLVTLGNKSVINENDMLDYWRNLPIDGQYIGQGGLSKFLPVGLYLESVSNGPEFVRKTYEISKDNPVFILKPGKSKAAGAAMRSHTGSIAGEDSVLEVALEEAGVIRCQELGDFFDMARALAWENVPTGPRVAVISNAGGPAVLSTDTISQTGLELAEFGEETKQKLAEILPRISSFMNPVDVLGDALAVRFGQALEIVLQESTVDAVVVILTPQLMTQITKTAEIISGLSRRYAQPIFCSFIGGGQTEPGEMVLNKNKIPSFPFPERAIKTLAGMWRWQKWRDELSHKTVVDKVVDDRDYSVINKIIAVATGENRKTLNNIEANEVIMAAEIPAPQTMEVSDVNQAEDFAQKVGRPVVLKLSSPGLLHKSDVGGVVTQIFDYEQMKNAWSKLGRKIEQLDADIKGIRIQVQKEIVGGVEVIVGVKRDPTFGPVLLFGAGGQLAELIADKNLHLLPLTVEDARELVMKSKIFKVLNGYRGEPPYSLEGLYDTMVKLGQVALHVSEIDEIEINPVKITLNGVYALDAKVVLGQGVARPVSGVQFKAATTISHKLLTGKIHIFEFETKEPLEYEAGQYISVKVAQDRINAYSIAGKLKPERFELLVDISPGGPGSKFFENLREGEKIAFIGPFGTFTLKPDDGAKNLLFLGTGSGCSPLRSMIESVLKDKKIDRQITLYFGLRFEEDIFWREYFENLAKEYPNFKFKLCLSKPKDGWQGLTGHITDLVKQDFANAGNCSAYLCGNKPMLEEAMRVLGECGCPKERIYQESFY
jgi:acetate---CoA ligase (ADP-forming)